MTVKVVSLVHFGVFKLDVLLKGAFRPVAPATVLCSAVKLPLDLFSSPTSAFVSFLVPFPLFLLRQLFLVPSCFVESCKLGLSDH